MKQPQPLDEAALRDSAAHYVSRFLATEYMLHQSLLRKILRWKQRAIYCGLDEKEIADTAQSLLPAIDKIVADMIRIGAVNDREYVAAQLRHQFVSGNSLRAIKNHCYLKGVPADTVDEICKDFLDDTEQTAENCELYGALRRLFKKKLGPFASKKAIDSGKNTQQKALLSLANAGFSYDIARESLCLSYEDAMTIIQKMRSIF